MPPEYFGSRSTERLERTLMNNCPSCGQQSSVNLKDGGRVCRRCGLFSAGAKTAATSECPAENNEKVFFHSKVRLFGDGLKRLKKIKPDGGRLLDIGCGYGYFMEAASQNGWISEGVEIAPKAVKYCREHMGLKVYDSVLAELNLSAESFDAVTMWGVLDSLSEPFADVARVGAILKPDGVLLIRVNNYSFHSAACRIGRTSFFRRTGVLPGVIHGWGFTAASLRASLEAAGFADIRMGNSLPTEGDPYSTGGALGEHFVRAAKFAVYAFSEVLRVVTFNRIFTSSALIVTAVKKDDKKKILHIITRLDAGGSARSVLSVCSGVRGRYSVVLASGSSDSRSRSLAREADVVVETVPSLRREISVLRDLAALVSLVALIKKTAPDIVHTHTSKAGFLGRWAAFFCNITRRPRCGGHPRIKIVHTPHGHIFYGYYGKIKTELFLIAERLSALITDVFVALTDGEKNETFARGVGKPEQWTVIHSGVEINPPVSPFTKGGVEGQKKNKDGIIIPVSPFFKGGKEGGFKIRESLNIPENALVIGTVARLEKVKGVEYFVRAAPLILDAFARSPSPSSSQGRHYSSGDIYFLVVGDGTLRGRLENLAAGLSAREKIIFAGARDDVFDMINAMDFYVQPSLNEGMGRTIVEAMYLAKPIVAAKVQGIPDLIKDGETGLLSPSANPGALAGAVVRLMNDETLAARLGRAALDFSTEQIAGGGRFSVERMIYLHEKLYEKM